MVSMVTRNRWSARTRAIVWSLIGLVVLVVASAAWVGVRGLLAKSELEKAAPIASTIEHEIVAGKTTDAEAESARLTRYADSAASLTSDPVWRVAEVVPWVGANLSAVREAASATDIVATQVVAPLTSIASNLNVSTFKPENGAINLRPIIAIQPKLSAAQSALDGVAKQVALISTTGTIQPVSSAVSSLSTSVDRATAVVDSVGNAVKLIPSMLGLDGARNYLLLFQNPAELRSTGGIAGAQALIHTDDGKITLAVQSSSAQIPVLDSPIAKLPIDTQGLYGQKPAEFIQDVNLTPNFPLSAQLASALWTHRYGSSVDGVITLDPIVLGYILNATGPITLPDNVTLTSANAVQVLLSQVYSMFPNNDEQDAFFAQAAANVFERVSAGNVNVAAMISALSQGGTERRILIWSAHPKEQAVLAGTTLAGELPSSTPKKAGIGVYLNDATGAKMDYYLSVEASSTSQICRRDGHPNARVTVTLKNTAPLDAATSLPAYVLGLGVTGIPSGSVRTLVSVYGPVGSLMTSTTSNGADFAHHAATDSGRAVSQFSVELATGESKTVTVDLLNMHQTANAVSLQMTPGIATRLKSSIAQKCATP